MPDLVGVFGQLDPLDFLVALVIEKAQLHTRGMRREQREIDAEAVPGGAQREGITFGHARVLTIACSAHAHYSGLGVFGALLRGARGFFSNAGCSGSLSGSVLGLLIRRGFAGAGANTSAVFSASASLRAICQ